MSESYKKQFVKAKKVMVDDYVKIGGRLFRAVNVCQYKDDVEIALDLVGAKNKHTTVLILPKQMLVKIMNQA